MQLQVKNVLGQSVLVEADGHDTIRSVKDIAGARFGLGSELRHRLFFQGRTLKDSALVASLNIQADQFLTFLTLQPKKAPELFFLRGSKSQHEKETPQPKPSPEFRASPVACGVADSSKAVLEQPVEDDGASRLLRPTKPGVESVGLPGVEGREPGTGGRDGSEELQGQEVEHKCGGTREAWEERGKPVLVIGPPLEDAARGAGEESPAVEEPGGCAGKRAEAPLFDTRQPAGYAMDIGDGVGKDSGEGAADGIARAPAERKMGHVLHGESHGGRSKGGRAKGGRRRKVPEGAGALNGSDGGEEGNMREECNKIGGRVDATQRPTGRTVQEEEDKGEASKSDKAYGGQQEHGANGTGGGGKKGSLVGRKRTVDDCRNCEDGEVRGATAQEGNNGGLERKARRNPPRKKRAVNRGSIEVGDEEAGLQREAGTEALNHGNEGEGSEDGEWAAASEMDSDGEAGAERKGGAGQRRVVKGRGGASETRKPAQNAGEAATGDGAAKAGFTEVVGKGAGEEGGTSHKASGPLNGRKGRGKAVKTSKAPKEQRGREVKENLAAHQDKAEDGGASTGAGEYREGGTGGAAAPPGSGTSRKKSGRRPKKVEEEGEVREERGKGKKAVSGLALLPLPPCLEILERKFTCLNAFYSFLLKQHIQATWYTTRQGVARTLGDIGGWTPEDVEHMARLCPKVVSTRDFVPPVDETEGEANFSIDLWDPTRPASEQLATVGLMMPSAPLGEEGYDIMPGGPKKPSQRAISRAEERRAKAFRQGLAALVGRVHADFLQQQGDLSEGKFDPIKEGRWHSDFPLADLSLSTFLAEAKATAMAADQLGLQAGLDGTPGSAPLAGDLPAGREEKWAPPRPPRQLKKVPRCTATTELTAHEMLAHLQSSLGSLGQMLHCEHLSKREAAYGQLAHELHPATWQALHRKGIQQLYIHQTCAINWAMGGRSVVVATATASGKSLCYNIPVIEALQASPDASALYLFPTKALAQDQQRALAELLEGMAPTPTIAVYDGDTCQSDRPEIRQNAQLIITNPDMLHVSILPSHSSFARILANLRYVVVDEAHAYKGAFGCHTALILRRLRRICNQVYGSHPTFIICSATVANPREHAQELTGLQAVEAVLEDGSPCGEKLFALWNPPVVHIPAYDKKLAKVRSRQKINFDCGRPLQTKRASPIVEVALLLAEMVQHGLRCIAFCGTRKLCELVYTYTRETLKDTAPQLVSTIRAYRSGYMAKERREIERSLFAGELRGVAATNALELGVDVGSLDATLHLGFQGTVASMWQQAGRAGRREKPSLSVYVAFESPLDQYFMKAPARLFSRPIEHAQVDSQNPEVMAQHLACAAFEHALRPNEDEEYFGSGVGPTAAELVDKGVLGRHATNGHIDKSWHYIGPAKSPSQKVGIRAIDPEKYAIVDERSNEVIEEVEESKAFFVVYEGAVYMQQGRTYLVKALSLAKREARCAQADLKYYTKTVDMTDVFVLGGSLAYHGRLPPDQYPSTTAQCSPCRVTTRWMGFRRIWQGSNDSFDFVQLFLPDVTFRSQAAWIRVPRGIRERVEAQEAEFRASLHAASHALVNVMPLYVMCSSADVGAECAHPNNSRYFPERILIYDRHPGGIGLAVQARPMFAELLRAALELVTSCDCSAEVGCPSCVQTLKCSEYNEVLNKRGAILILQGVIEAEDAYREGRAVPPPLEELPHEAEWQGPSREWSHPVGGFYPPSRDTRL